MTENKTHEEFIIVKAKNLPKENRGGCKDEATLAGELIGLDEVDKLEGKPFHIGWRKKSMLPQLSSINDLVNKRVKNVAILSNYIYRKDNKDERE